MTAPSNFILIVDDNDDDVYALKRALKKANVANPHHAAKNGREAVDYLTGHGPYGDRSKYPLPFLIFLDLKMPFLDGFDVLAWIRTQPELSAIVVVVLTGSDEIKDHQRAYALGARSYLVKPAAPGDVAALMDSMQSYWLRATDRGPLVTIPPSAAD